MASLLPYDTETTQEFFAAFLSTDLGKRMDSEDLLTNENVRRLVQLAQEAKGTDAITVADFARAAKSLYLAGDLLPEPQAAPEPEPAPRPLTPSQEAFREARIYTESHSAKDCENRAKTDRVYAAYLHKLRVGEFEATQATVPDAVVNLNEKKPLAKGNIPEAVATFAEDYRHMSVAQAKSLMSPGVAGEAVAAHYQKLFAAACEAGLI